MNPQSTDTADWIVYLISNGRRTYVGMTNNFSRRLRQHNGELAGGARSTSNSLTPWVPIAILIGFPSKGSTLTWEALIKKRARGKEARIAAMMLVGEGGCPSGRKVFIPPSVVFLDGGELSDYLTGSVK